MSKLEHHQGSFSTLLGVSLFSFVYFLFLLLSVVEPLLPAWAKPKHLRTASFPRMAAFVFSKYGRGKTRREVQAMLTQSKSSSSGRSAKRFPIIEKIRLRFAGDRLKGNVFCDAWWGEIDTGLLVRKIFNNWTIPITIAIFMCSDIQAANTSLTTPYFTNVTEKVGLNNVSGFRVSVADVNGDSYPDVLLHQIPDEVRGDAPCRIDLPDDVYTCKDQFLYLNIEGSNADEPHNRKFVDFTEESGIRVSRRDTKDRRSNLSVFSDVDNDGDLDLFSGVYGHRVKTQYNDNGDRNDLFLNDGSGHFTLARNSPFHDEKFWNTSSAVFLDYDRDGNIDLFTGNGWLENYEVDQLYRGKGDGSFTNLTNFTGIDIKQPTYAVTAADTNNDGFIDLFSGNYCRDHSAHWQNNGNGTFTQVRESTNYGKFIGPGFGTCSWGSMPRDFDNDGDVDFFDLIVHGKEGGEHSTVLVNLLAEENREYFFWDFDKIVRPNDPDPTHHRDHYGSWFDIDNDGLADFILSQSDHLDLFKQETSHGFEIVNIESGLDGINTLNLSPGNVIPLDYDLDGDEDLLIGFDGKQNEVQLWRNDVGTLNNWLTVMLEGGGADEFSSKSAIGARVEVSADGKTYTREIYAGNGHFGPQAPLSLTFGIAQAEKVDEIRVYWPNRTRTTTVLRDIDVNQFIHIHESVIGITEIKDALAPDEPSLLGADGVLDRLYGLANLERIHDTDDQYWTEWVDEGSVEVKARHADRDGSLQVLDGRNFRTPVLENIEVGGSGQLTSLDAGQVFKWGLSTSYGSYSSLSFQNPDGALHGADHMVTWRVKSAENTYVIAWEDTDIPAADQDFQDAVIEVSNVVPNKQVNAFVNLIGDSDETTDVEKTDVVYDSGSSTFTIMATFINNSDVNIKKPFFGVVELSGGNKLLNADGGAAAGVGATLTPNVGDDQVLSSGEQMTVKFEIGLQTTDRFDFFVDLFRGIDL